MSKISGFLRTSFMYGPLGNLLSGRWERPSRSMQERRRLHFQCIYCNDDDPRKRETEIGPISFSNHLSLWSATVRRPPARHAPVRQSVRVCPLPPSLNHLSQFPSETMKRRRRRNGGLTNWRGIAQETWEDTVTHAICPSDLSLATYQWTCLQR